MTKAQPNKATNASALPSAAEATDTAGLSDFEGMINLDDFLPYRTARLAALLSKGLAARYQQQFDISVVEWRVIVHLTQQSQISVRDIFDRVDMDRARVTRAVQRLEARSLVSKTANPDDRRLLHLALTTAGWNLAGELSHIAKNFAKTALTGIDAASQAELIGLINQIEANVVATD